MFHSIRHVTRFAYSAPISQSMMEVRKQPRSDGHQRCLRFDLVTSPRSRTMGYRDHLGNIVHHFDIPGRHSQLEITAEAVVESGPPPPLPEALAAESWAALDELTEQGDYWDWLAPSHFAQPTEKLRELARELRAERRGDPLSLLRELNVAIYDAFDYVPQSTEVDSPIDDALGARRGVCQDFAHVMIALVRELRVPCRYVSGYLVHRGEDTDRSADGATHAWLEALLPELGWVGFDPTNKLIAGERHIRVAIGRDYDDVPPTRGVYKGKTETELSVGVKVSPSEGPVQEPDLLPVPHWVPSAIEDEEEQQQQQ
jgi:transglutaminase-like putative cysteine protease